MPDTNAAPDRLTELEDQDDRIRFQKQNENIRRGLREQHGDELPGMWDFSDLYGGWADTESDRKKEAA